MPKLFSALGYYVFFWSNEGRPVEPVHVHVGKDVAANTTKIWILSDGTTQIESNASQVKAKDLKRIQDAIELYAESIIEQWEEFFGCKATFCDEQ